jgi:hypothetical protein
MQRGAALYSQFPCLLCKNHELPAYLLTYLLTSDNESPVKSYTSIFEHFGVVRSISF